MFLSIVSVDEKILGLGYVKSVETSSYFSLTCPSS